MLIGCPSCATHFAVPDTALMPKGRTLKCAKCGHKWFQDPPEAEEPAAPSFSFSPEPEAAPRPSFDFNPVRNPDPDLEFDAPPPSAAASAARMRADMDIDLDDAPDVPVIGGGLRSGEKPIEFDLDALEPQPIPEMFANKDPKKGTGGLWFLLVLLLLGGLGGAAYLFQDRLIGYVPMAHEVLDQIGLRREKPGAGLELRNAGTPERFVHNDTEVLIVRGIIANVSDRARPVPTMKLVLLDKAKNPVQEKLSQPPVTQLDPGGTSSFRIILERPDPTAVEVNVLFVESAEPGK